MKLPVRSLRVPLSFQRQRLRFFGKSTILNLHETGITIEGMMPDVHYPILMRFVWRALSNWTIRTIPFSRIVKCNLIRHTRLRLISSVLAVLLCIYLSVALWDYLWVCAIAIVSIACFQYLIMRWAMKNSVEIEYMTNDAKPCAVRLRFHSASDERKWFEELSRHRLESAAPTIALLAKNITTRRSMWQRMFGRGPDRA